MGRNDSAWESLFQRYDILNEIERKGRFLISARQIKDYREPRLMTKFDHRVNLPSLFAENGLAILPVSRGDYVISSFQAYRAFEEPSGDAVRVSPPLQLQSLLPQFLVSEAIALNFAWASGILSDFLEEPSVIPTVSGRMGSGEFSFCIQTASGSRSVAVNNAQIEIDAAYEGELSLALCEAKRDLAEDFLIRQLYYPYRVWRGRITKRARPVFLVFTNGVFHLYEYAFGDPGDYNSLRLVKQKNYIIRTDITERDIWGLLRSVRAEPEPDTAFPQADSFPRLLNLMELLAERPLTREDITGEYAFDARQTNYYTDAGRYLGLVEKERENGAVVFRLSDQGRALMGLDYRERQLSMAAAVLRHGIFRDILRLRLETGVMPDRAEVVRRMRNAGLYRMDSESTFLRRSSTVLSWVSWILSRIG